MKTQTETMMRNKIMNGWINMKYENKTKEEMGYEELIEELEEVE